jgi:hypothetical protein
MREIRTSSSMRAWRKRIVGTTRRARHRESGSSQQVPPNPSDTAPPRRLYIYLNEEIEALFEGELHQLLKRGAL